ncbi:large neutral amino acids transporter small subunit 2-like [Parasteatoda tepidariorum]|uniref:large neutral amino acids transporter small subunit 2-like n=1 Tax=Parasteatoda tepidariorum TaxID=114398 RepID=UPI00077FE0D7|nr:large neutral amino acids transporter small subunit 2-like [Parasteatoda tepidariorum]
MKNNKSGKQLKMTNNNSKNELEECIENDEVKMKKRITLTNGVAIIVGTIIGSGIFISPKGVYEHSGSLGVALIIWTACGIFSMFGALCFAELGTCITKSGGDYAYLMEAFGPATAFLYLWVGLLVIRPAVQAVLALTFGYYMLDPFFPNCKPPDEALRLLAGICLCLLSYVNCRSVRWAMRVQDLFTGAKLFALIFIIIGGAWRIGQGHTEYLENAFDANVSAKSISLAFYYGLFAYAGWNYLNFVTGELKDPYKNLPRAIWIGLPLVTIVYVLSNIAYFAVISPTQLLASPAVAVTFATVMFGAKVAWCMPIFVALSTFGGVNGNLFTSGRFFAMAAQEGQLPEILGMINVKRCTPVPAVLLTCLMSLMMLCTSDVYVLINYLSFAQWFWTGVVIVGLMVMRVTKPDLHRPIKVSLFCPIVFLGCCIFLVFVPMLAEPFETGIVLLVMFAGLPVYFLFLRNPKPTPLHKDTMNSRITKCLQKLFEVVTPEEKYA